MRSRRLARCSGCGLARALCLCAEIPRLSLRTRVALVMHRNEAPKSTNTGRLALSMLEGASLRVRGRPREIASPPPTGRRLVLFPMPDARLLTPADADGEAPVLIVPDGSWSQARRMLVRDPWTRDAEVVRVECPIPARYPLRRNRRAGTACTLEAIARALGILEGEHVEQTMLRVLALFVERVLYMRTEGAELERQSRNVASDPV